MKTAFTGAALALTTLALAACQTTREATPAAGPVAVLNPCADLTVSIYFERDSAQLTREARAVLRGAAAQVSGCSFAEVDVYGLADPVGSPQANLVVSDARAKVVTAELGRLGFNSVNFRLVAAGDTGAVTETGEVRPMRRRADVIFRPAKAS